MPHAEHFRRDTAGLPSGVIPGVHPAALQGGRPSARPCGLREEGDSCSFLWPSPCSQWPAQAQGLQGPTHAPRAREGERTKVWLWQDSRAHLSIPYHQTRLAQHFPARGSTSVHQHFFDTKIFPWKISDWPVTSASISNEPLQASGDCLCVYRLEKGVICTLHGSLSSRHWIYEAGLRWLAKHPSLKLRKGDLF